MKTFRNFKTKNEMRLKGDY